MACHVAHLPAVTICNPESPMNNGVKVTTRPMSECNQTSIPALLPVSLCPCSSRLHHPPLNLRHLSIWYLINGVKLRYLCRNKLPRIILVLMYNDDYVINVSSISPGVRHWLMGKCRKCCSQVVMGRSICLKCKVDDQTIIDNCEISRTKIGLLESVNGSFPG